MSNYGIVTPADNNYLRTDYTNELLKYEFMFKGLNNDKAPYLFLMLFGTRHNIINRSVNKNQAITLRKSIMKHITLNKNVCKIYE